VTHFGVFRHLSELYKYLGCSPHKQHLAYCNVTPFLQYILNSLMYDGRWGCSCLFAYLPQEFLFFP